MQLLRFAPIVVVAVLSSDFATADEHHAAPVAVEAPQHTESNPGGDSHSPPPSDEYLPSELCREEYAELGSLQLLTPANSLPGMLQPFVHQRQTVPVSERMAEIWITLPADRESSVSVNFVEYPPEGEFRVFKTKLTTRDPRRFYLSARSWDIKANRWIALVPKDPLSQDDTPRNWYVDLSPMERVNVEFLFPSPTEVICEQPSVVPPTTVAPPAVNEELRRNIQSISESLQNQDKKLNQLTEVQSKQTKSLRPIRQQLARIEAASAPSALSENVTKQFRFDPTRAKLTGKYVIESGQRKIVWTVSPQSITIMTQQNSIQALPARPFKADITMSVREPGKSAFATLSSIPVRFEEANGQVGGQISFDSQLAQPLTEAILTQDNVPANLQVTARMRYVISLGELDEVVVEGSLGNWFPIEISQ